MYIDHFVLSEVILQAEEMGAVLGVCSISQVWQFLIGFSENLLKFIHKFLLFVIRAQPTSFFWPMPMFLFFLLAIIDIFALFKECPFCFMRLNKHSWSYFAFSQNDWLNWSHDKFRMHDLLS